MAPGASKDLRDLVIPVTYTSPEEDPDLPGPKIALNKEEFEARFGHYAQPGGILKEDIFPKNAKPVLAYTNQDTYHATQEQITKARKLQEDINKAEADLKAKNKSIQALQELLLREAAMDEEDIEEEDSDLDM